jgi:hypothetical protein
MTRRSRSTLAAGGALAVGLVIALLVVVVRQPSGADPPPAAARAIITSAASTAAPAVPVPAAAPAVPHDEVPPAAPTDFRITGPAFDIGATVCQMPYVRPLDPPGDQYHTVCWVNEGFGVAPGSSSGGTSYILGHSWARAPLVLNQLSETAMQEFTGAPPVMEGSVPIYPFTGLNGYKIALVTSTGTLVYSVTRSYAVDKSQAGDVDSLMANSPDRVVIITCAVQGGVDLEYNVIVEAMLESSTAV